MALSATHYHRINLSRGFPNATPAQAPDSRPHSYHPSQSRDTSPSFRESPEYPHNAPPPNYPPSPPMERPTHISLPPISTLLGPLRQSSIIHEQRTKISSMSNGVHCSDFANAPPPLVSPPTPPTRHERIDFRHMPGPQRTMKRLPPMHTPYASPSSMRRLPPRVQPEMSPVRDHRQSTSSFSTSSALSTRAVSPSSVHSAPAEVTHRHARELQPATTANQHSLPSEYTPVTPRSPPSATSLISRASDRESLWRRASTLHYTPKIPHSLYTHTPSGTRSFPLPYPPQPVTIPPSDFRAGSDVSQQQLPDRYICPSCAKAFSRPSSLRIHVHSHTGEKPFRCPHRGCGKAFSVRSNMKRHQRGCSSHVEVAVTSPVSFTRGVTSGMEIGRVLS